MPEFAGLKVTQDAAAARELGLLRVELAYGLDRILIEPRGRIGWGGNSGFHALNLAVQSGARRIILVGYDLNLEGGVHWHGAHARVLHDPSAINLRRWARILDQQAPLLAELGVEVLNASPTSALQAFRKVDFEEALRA